MNAFRAKGRKFFETKVPVQVEGKVAWKKQPTGTVDPVVARAIDTMVAYLGPQKKQAWDVLGAVTGTPQRWTLAELYRRWSGVGAGEQDDDGEPKEITPKQRLAAVREQLHDVDLEPLVDKFHGVLLKPGSTVGEDTANHYRSAVRLFIPAGAPFPRSRLRERELRVWVEEMDDVAPGTVRKRGIGMGRFTAWLVGRGLLSADPMRDIVLPPQGDPLTHYIDTPDVLTLADTLAGQMRLFEVLLPATGLEVSTALALRVRAVSLVEKQIHAPGTKSASRNRVVRVAEYGMDAARELLRGKHPDTRLFDRIPHRWAAGDEHRAAVERLGAAGHRVFIEWEDRAKLYTMRDHRHTWAVRAARTGWPPAAIAEQLGHSDGGVLALNVYGKFAPKKEERDRWERQATARDEEVQAARKRQGDA
jgi:site-specific recombinase XerD